MKTELESTTQEHTKNISYMVRLILPQTNLQWVKERTPCENEDEIDQSHNYNFNIKFIH